MLYNKIDKFLNKTNTGENMVYENLSLLASRDADVAAAVKKELERQQNSIELIASENFVSEAVMAANASVLTNKYAEGYPAKRYYGGCECVDVVENIAIERAKKLFGAEFANVQPHSGAQANTAVYVALLNHGDTVMGMSLADGGHLTHGSPVNFSGINYNFVSYGVDSETGLIDYDKVEALALWLEHPLHRQPLRYLLGGRCNHQGQRLPESACNPCDEQGCRIWRQQPEGLVFIRYLCRRRR